MTFARFFYDDTKYKHYQRYLLDSLNSRKSEKMINCLIFTSHKLMKLLQPDWQITFFCFCFYQRKLKKPVFIIPVLMIQQFSCKFSSFRESLRKKSFPLIRDSFAEQSLFWPLKVESHEGKRKLDSLWPSRVSRAIQTAFKDGSSRKHINIDANKQKIFSLFLLHHRQLNKVGRGKKQTKSNINFIDNFIVVWERKFCW